MRWQVLLGLILCNAIWASVPMAGKWVLEIYAPMETAFFRYTGALITVLILSAPGVVRSRNTLATQIKKLFAPRWMPWFLLIGSTTFFLSPLAQYWGLKKSTASASSLIVAIEPIFTALLAWIFLHEKMSRIQWVGFIAAFGGFLLLSNIDPMNFFGSFAFFNAANLFYVLTMPCEAAYTVACRKLAGVSLTDRELYGGSILVGVLGLTLLLHFGPGFPDMSKMTLKVFLAILWFGPLGNAITYLYWSKALQEVPVAAVALTLFVQPILGALFGRLFLYEYLSFWQFTGAVFILSALGLQAYYYRRTISP